MKSSEILMLVATFVQAAALLWTIHVMEDTSQRQLRAYADQSSTMLITPKSLTKKVLGYKNRPNININFQNYGQTPAYNLTSFANIKILNTEDENELSVSKLNGSSTSLGAGKNIFKTIWFDRELTKQEISDINTGKSVIYFYGKIEYTDVFKEKHSSNFRLKYVGVYPPTIEPATLTFCDKGNETN